MQRGAFCIFYVLICVPQNLYVEALILNVTVLEDRAFKEVIKGQSSNNSETLIQ